MKGLEDQLLGRVILTEKAVSCLSLELEFSLFVHSAFLDSVTSEKKRKLSPSPSKRKPKKRNFFQVIVTQLIVFKVEYWECNVSVITDL